MVKGHSEKKHFLPSVNATLYGRKEGNVLFNDAHSTFYLRLHGVAHIYGKGSFRKKKHFLPSVVATLYGRKEGNVLFNNALNTFYLRLYGVRLMVENHSNSEKGNPLPRHRLLFPISSKGSFICIIPQTV